MITKARYVCMLSYIQEKQQQKVRYIQLLYGTEYVRISYRCIYIYGGLCCYRICSIVGCLCRLRILLRQHTHNIRTLTVRIHIRGVTYNITARSSMYIQFPYGCVYAFVQVCWCCVCVVYVMCVAQSQSAIASYMFISQFFLLLYFNLLFCLFDVQRCLRTHVSMQMMTFFDRLLLLTFFFTLLGDSHSKQANFCFPASIHTVLALAQQPDSSFFALFSHSQYRNIEELMNNPNSNRILLRCSILS